MRELKFRAWGNNIREYIGDANGVADVTSMLGDLLKQGGWVIEQYTGLKGKNGKEIYEGDILKFDGRFYKVVFDEYGRFCLENKKHHWLSSNYSFSDVSLWCADGILVEIIGNIHENPELLEQEDAKG